MRESIILKGLTEIDPVSIMPKVYRNSTRTLIENGAIIKIPEIMSFLKARKILVVIGNRSFKNSIHFEKLERALADFEWQISDPVSENPQIAFVRDFYKRYRDQGFDTVVGLGGGSAIDVAKMAAVLLPNGVEVLDDYLASKTPFKDRLALVAVPTTAGTGSEVTPYTSLEADELKKITVTDEKLFPDFAILDPLLTHSMPPKLTASTGMDALSQAIEAFWSVHHSPFSDTHALRAVSLIAPNLKKAVRDPWGVEVRFAMALGACESGFAIAQTATTAVHAVSYPITTYFGVPHGHACALTLAKFIRFNEDAMREPRYQELWRALGVGSAVEAAGFVEKLMDDISLERRLSRLGIDAKGIQTVIQNGFRPDRVKNNPKPLTPEALRKMLEAIL